MKLLLILGCQRSGTTLLASMLGRHSEINMLFESTSADVLKLIGKDYQGNKLCVWRQIRLNQKSSKWGHLINRIVNFHFFNYKYQNKRIYPTSVLSIQDYIDKGATIITIRRDEEAIVKSLLKRTPLSKSQAKREFDLSTEILDSVKDKAIEVNFKDLLDQPESIMQSLCSKLGLEYEMRMLEGSKYNIIYPHNKILPKDM